MRLTTIATRKASVVAAEIAALAAICPRASPLSRSRLRVGAARNGGGGSHRDTPASEASA